MLSLFFFSFFFTRLLNQVEDWIEPNVYLLTYFDFLIAVIQCRSDGLNQKLESSETTRNKQTKFQLITGKQQNIIDMCGYSDGPGSSYVELVSKRLTNPDGVRPEILKRVAIFFYLVVVMCLLLPVGIRCQLVPNSKSHVWLIFSCWNEWMSEWMNELTKPTVATATRPQGFPIWTQLIQTK